MQDEFLKEPPKLCKECKKTKPAVDFSINQYGKNNRILRRPICKVCYALKKKIPFKIRKEYEKNNPRPAIGEEFKCPICERVYLHQFNNDVVLDHSHNTGEIRGYICGSCNASIGKFQEDTNILARAIAWINGTLKNIGLSIILFFKN